jgi:hypothetical protein
MNQGVAMKTVLSIFIFTVFYAIPCFSADLQIGEKVVLNGNLYLTENSIIEFSDGTSMSTAVGGGYTWPTWGSIVGNIAYQWDLMDALSLKANVDSLNQFEKLIHRGQSNGYASLDSSGKVPSSQLPPQIPGPSGADGLNGKDGVDGLPGLRGASFVLTSTALTNSPNYSGAWTTGITSWSPLAVPYEVNVTAENSYIRVTWSDIVGIYGPNWCNVGIFVDGNILNPPACSGAWSGVSNTTIFNTQTLLCVLPQLSVGVHSIGVFHRSQYCYYGYTAFNDLTGGGGSRKLIIEALQ